MLVAKSHFKQYAKEVLLYIYICILMLFIIIPDRNLTETNDNGLNL